jgi:proline racemase
MPAPTRLAFVDSHTEGEPTRVVFDDLPEVDGSGPARIRRLVEQHPYLRAAIVDEPRGYPALVAALLLPPTRAEVTATVAFFNNVGMLPMCVHASIGIARTLVWLGRAPATAWAAPLVLETIAGDVSIRLEANDVIAVTNVPAYRLHANLELPSSRGPVRADVAWGGNWFLIVERSPIPVTPAHTDELLVFTRELRATSERMGLRGDGDAIVDHVQLCGPSDQADARNFVLCPGGEFDRSPCGTGTSARMACLHADGRLAPGRVFRQQGIGGTCFDGELIQTDDKDIRPIIRGRAWVTAAGQLSFDPSDPFTRGATA